MKNDEKPIANPFVLLREEFDDWAILFNPDAGHGFGLSPIGVYVWKLLDGEHTIDEMLTALRRDALDVPENVHHDVGAFVDARVAQGLARFQSTESYPLAVAQRRAPYLEKCPPVGGQSEAKPFTYAPSWSISPEGRQPAGITMITGQPAATAKAATAPLIVALLGPAAPLLRPAAAGPAATKVLAPAGRDTAPLGIVLTVAPLEITHVIAGVERALIMAGATHVRTASLPVCLVEVAAAVVQRSDYSEVEDVRKRVGCRGKGTWRNSLSLYLAEQVIR